MKVKRIQGNKVNKKHQYLQDNLELMEELLEYKEIEVPDKIAKELTGVYYIKEEKKLKKVEKEIESNKE